VRHRTQGLLACPIIDLAQQACAFGVLVFLDLSQRTDFSGHPFSNGH